jgi:ribosome-associated protein
MNESITINDQLTLPYSDVSFRFARSGGSGGQNVNKVETRVELLFDVAGSKSLTEEQRRQIMGKLRSYIDSAGMLRIVAQESRSQWRNRVDAMERFAELVREALKPVKKRVATKSSRASKQKRLDNKKRRSETKQYRRSVM